MPKQSSDPATAYVITYSGKESGDLGHTSAYVEGPSGFIHRSFFPSSTHAAVHNSLHGMVPVYGFNTKGPSSDAKYEGGAPTSILKIEGLNFEAMQKEQDAFLNDIKTMKHLFSLNHSSGKNIFHYGLFAYNKIFQPSKTKIGGFDPVIKKFPTCDDLIVVKPKTEASTKLSNCTSAVHQLLTASGSFEVKEPNPILSYLFPSSSVFQPAPFKRAVESSGGVEMIHNPKELPAPLQKMISDGQHYFQRKIEAPDSVDQVERHRRLLD